MSKRIPPEALEYLKGLGKYGKPGGKAAAKNMTAAERSSRVKKGITPRRGQEAHRGTSGTRASSGKAIGPVPPSRRAVRPSGWFVRLG
ncbi:MAG TPA: hypothetical protein VEV17_24935 [Bryobacteraceae bacterium]|nr:hypothetical protein [Bryobacteraceae bacterium]